MQLSTPSATSVFHNASDALNSVSRTVLAAVDATHNSKDKDSLETNTHALRNATEEVASLTTVLEGLNRVMHSSPQRLPTTPPQPKRPHRRDHRTQRNDDHIYKRAEYSFRASKLSGAVHAKSRVERHLDTTPATAILHQIFGGPLGLEKRQIAVRLPNLIEHTLNDFALKLPTAAKLPTKLSRIVRRLLLFIRWCVGSFKKPSLGGHIWPGRVAVSSGSRPSFGAVIWCVRGAVILGNLGGRFALQRRPKERKGGKRGRVVAPPPPPRSPAMSSVVASSYARVSSSHRHGTPQSTVLSHNSILSEAWPASPTVSYVTEPYREPSVAGHSVVRSYESASSYTSVSHQVEESVLSDSSVRSMDSFVEENDRKKRRRERREAIEVGAAKVAGVAAVADNCRQSNEALVDMLNAYLEAEDGDAVQNDAVRGVLSRAIQRMKEAESFHTSDRILQMQSASHMAATLTAIEAQCAARGIPLHDPTSPSLSCLSHRSPISAKPSVSFRSHPSSGSSSRSSSSPFSSSFSSRSPSSPSSSSCSRREGTFSSEEGEGEGDALRFRSVRRERVERKKLLRSVRSIRNAMLIAEPDYTNRALRALQEGTVLNPAVCTALTDEAVLALDNTLDGMIDAGHITKPHEETFLPRYDECCLLQDEGFLGPRGRYAVLRSQHPQHSDGAENDDNLPRQRIRKRRRFRSLLTQGSTTQRRNTNPTNPNRRVTFQDEKTPVQSASSGIETGESGSAGSSGGDSGGDGIFRSVGEEGAYTQVEKYFYFLDDGGGDVVPYEKGALFPSTEIAERPAEVFSPSSVVLDEGTQTEVEVTPVPLRTADAQTSPVWCETTSRTALLSQATSPLLISEEPAVVLTALPSHSSHSLDSNIEQKTDPDADNTPSSTAVSAVLALLTTTVEARLAEDRVWLQNYNNNNTPSTPSASSADSALAMLGPILCDAPTSPFSLASERLGEDIGKDTKTHSDTPSPSLSRGEEESGDLSVDALRGEKGSNRSAPSDRTAPPESKPHAASVSTPPSLQPVNTVDYRKAHRWYDLDLCEAELQCDAMRMEQAALLKGLTEGEVSYSEPEPSSEVEADWREPCFDPFEGVERNIMKMMKRPYGVVSAPHPASVSSVFSETEGESSHESSSVAASYRSLLDAFVEDGGPRGSVVHEYSSDSDVQWARGIVRRVHLFGGTAQLPTATQLQRMGDSTDSGSLCPDSDDTPLEEGADSSELSGLSSS